MQLRSYASDLIEDAMMLAQTKAINSYSFRDILNSLTELWGYCYEKVALVDTGFYSQTIRLTEKLTRLPPFVKNTVRVYSARDVVGFSRKIYKQSGMNDLNAPLTFHVSGQDVYCWDASQHTVWLEYVPEQPFITFTKNNRDPKIVWKPSDGVEEPTFEYTNRNYGLYKLLTDVVGTTNAGDPIYADETGENAQSILEQETFVFQHRITGELVDKTSDIYADGFKLSALILDHPWMFISYKNLAFEDKEEHESYITQDVLTEGMVTSKYNPFDYQGRGSNVQFMKARYNDYTGMGVTIKDHEDGLIKELGWTPDTLMIYPSRIMYNYMVASMAQRFAALSGSQIMAVEMALVQASDELGNWLKRNKSAWMRMDNVTGPTLGDYL